MAPDRERGERSSRLGDPEPEGEVRGGGAAQSDYLPFILNALNQLSAEVARLHGRLDGVEKTTEKTTAQGFEFIGARIDSVGRRLDELDKSVSRLRLTFAFVAGGFTVLVLSTRPSASSPRSGARATRGSSRYARTSSSRGRSIANLFRADPV